MEEENKVIEEPKKKTGLIIGIIALVVLVCAGVAVALLNPFGGGFGGGQNDRVPKALANLFSEGAPTNVEMDGVITLSNSAPTDGFPLTKITLDNYCDALRRECNYLGINVRFTKRKNELYDNCLSKYFFTSSIAFIVSK